MSAWDQNWQANFGGYDEPNAARAICPTAFRPRLNPFTSRFPTMTLPRAASTARRRPSDSMVLGELPRRRDFRLQGPLGRDPSRRQSLLRPMGGCRSVRGGSLAIRFRKRSSAHEPQPVRWHRSESGRPRLSSKLRSGATVEWRFADDREMPRGPLETTGPPRQPAPAPNAIDFTPPRQLLFQHPTRSKRPHPSIESYISFLRRLRPKRSSQDGPDRGSVPNRHGSRSVSRASPCPCPIRAARLPRSPTCQDPRRKGVSDPPLQPAMKTSHLAAVKAVAIDNLCHLPAITHVSQPSRHDLNGNGNGSGIGEIHHPRFRPYRRVVDRLSHGRADRHETHPDRITFPSSGERCRYDRIHRKIGDHPGQLMWISV